MPAPASAPDLAPLRSRLRGIVILACLVPVLLAVSLSIRSACAGLQTRIETGRTALDTFAQAYVREKLHGSEQQIAALARRLDLDALDAGHTMVNSDWHFVQRLNSGAHHIFFYDLRRNDIRANIVPDWQADNDFDPSTRPWFAGLASTPDAFFWTDVYREYHSRTPVISVSRSIYDGAGTLRGLLCLMLELDELRDAMAALVTGQRGVVQLERNDGTRLLSTASAWLHDTLATQPSGMEASLWTLIRHGAVIPVYLDAPAWVLRLHIPPGEVRSLLLAEIGNSLLPMLLLFAALALLMGYLLKRYEEEQLLLATSLEGLNEGRSPNQSFTDLMFVGHNIRHLGKLASTLDAHRSAALRDGLTGCFNRHAFSADFTHATSSAQHKLGLVLFDLDHFKHINDTFGHSFGDAVLTRLTESLRQAGFDHHLYRFGGDEFALLLPGDDALRAASLLCKRVRALEWRERGLRLTVSVGVALGHECADQAALLELADARLYESKRAGRDRATLPPQAA